ncbi:MAG: hypothetical protein BWY85_00465 [Firmicutes bacterium ADurb.Bin506]|jgi:hypothetical protein|nr:MAG: hypothetical protein BWY85_00465 [Firmicutes bacterium ADurb.Bin506]
MAEDLFNDEVTGQFIGSSAIEQFLSKCGQSCGCPVTVRYECGECCLKAMNCRLAGVVNGFLALRAFSPPGIITEPCECEEEEEEEENGLFGLSSVDAAKGPVNAIPYPPPMSFAQCALIPLDKVCSIESGAVQPLGVAASAEKEAEKAD